MPDAPTPKQSRYDAVVVGSGPNGLAAAIRLAREGRSVLVVERSETPGGGTRTAELTLPGFRHDVCSAAHPMGLAAPFLKTLPLADFGLRWIYPDLPVAQTLDPARGKGDGIGLLRSVDETAAQLGSTDSKAYRSLFGPLTRDAPGLFRDLLGPLGIPKSPVGAARFGMRAMWPATLFGRTRFSEEPARALFAGNAAHSILSLHRPFTSAIGLMLQTAAHAVGWPIAKGGSEAIWRAMAGYLESIGGEICCAMDITTIEELPESDAVLFDTSPSAMVRIAGDQLPERYTRRLGRYRHGPGVFKLDLALSEPIPWRSEACRRAGTVHLGGSAEEIALSEAAMERGRIEERPFVLVSQPTVFDRSRAPSDRHVGWAYCHVPAGWEGDASEQILGQIERFAPGFRDTILGSHSMGCGDFERYNPNYIGGDISCGANDLRQLLTRPVVRRDPYSTPNPRIFLCSAATPPGAGVHGMCGYYAAGSVLREGKA